MALYYLENVPHSTTKTGEKINTVSHFDYISREGKYEHLQGREEDMVYTSSGNMPSWAETPKDFWKAAENHRRMNGRAYREVRVALQEEFTLQENIQLVESFCERFGISASHAYTYAIHDKKRLLMIRTGIFTLILCLMNA